MDDSRSVLSSGALVSRAALPSQTSPAEFHFVCRSCGGTEFRLETRPGVEVWMASLKVYQAVAFSHLLGHHDLYTCTRCEASVREAHQRLREVLLGKMLFAAKDLAERQFTRSKQHGATRLICVECRTAQVADSYLRHKDHCTVGRVMGLLQSLMGLENPDVLNRALSCGAEDFTSFASAAARAEIGGAQ